MPHREPKDWERCAKSLMTGVHTWDFSMSMKDELTAVGVNCLHCGMTPPARERERLVSMFRETKEAQAMRNHLHDAQRRGTGRQLARGRR